MEPLVRGGASFLKSLLASLVHTASFSYLGDLLEMLLHIEGQMRICSYLGSAFVRMLSFSEKDQIGEGVLRYDMSKKVALATNCSSW